MDLVNSKSHLLYNLKEDHRSIYNIIFQNKHLNPGFLL